MLKRIRVIIALGLGVGMLAVCGCSHTGGTTVEKRGDVYKVTANSTILKNRVKITERTVRRVNGLIDVQIRGTNLTGKDLFLEYRFIWLDQDGVELESALSTWKPLPVRAKAEIIMKGIAPVPQAEDFNMEIRFSKTSEN